MMFVAVNETFGVMADKVLCTKVRRGGDSRCALWELVVGMVGQAEFIAQTFSAGLSPWAFTTFGSTPSQEDQHRYEERCAEVRAEALAAKKALDDQLRVVGAMRS